MDKSLEKEELVRRLELCRNDFLYGETGRPCRDTAKLARKHNIESLIIARHSSAWLAEVRANNRTISSVYSLAVDPETIESYHGDVNFMREQLDKLEQRISEMPVEQIGGETYEFITKQILKIHTCWSKLVGVQDAIRVAALAKLTAIREEVKHAMDAEREKPSAPADPVEGARQVQDLKIFDIRPPEAQAAG